jgi:cephalosporin hydroxylase
VEATTTTAGADYWDGKGKGRVCIAYLHDEHLSHSFAESLRKAWQHDRRLPEQNLIEEPLNIRCSSGRLVPSRNFAVALFLDRVLDADWLLFVDTDMAFEPDAIHRLLEVADPETRPVVGGLCFALMDGRYDGMNGRRFTIVPTMYRIGKTSEGKAQFCYYGPYPQDDVVPVAATGAAFFLAHRSVWEAIRGEFGDHWFDQVYDTQSTMVGEDFSFFLRVNKVIEPATPVVHTGVKTTHHKEVWLSEEDYIAQLYVTQVLEQGHVPEVPTYVDMAASLTSLQTNQHVRDDGMLKLADDLERYVRIIEATQPNLIIETGTHAGQSARYFTRFDSVKEVITIDVKQPDGPLSTISGRVLQVVGDSVDPDIVAKVADLAAGHRTMVVLDSDHSAEHVAREIAAYGPMVTPGCYLVVEDTIMGWAPEGLRRQHFPDGLVGSPMDAVTTLLLDNDEWSRDVAIERLAPVTHHPAGFWIKNG